LTLRRLMVLVRALPSDALVWQVREEAERKALKPTPDKIRDRQAHYAKRAEEATE